MILLTRPFLSFKLAMLIWAFVKVPSSSPGGLIAEHTTLSGASLSWAWLSALNSALGIYATLGVNIPDFTVCDSSYCCAIEVLTAMSSDMQRTSERRSPCALFPVANIEPYSPDMHFVPSQYIQLIIIPIVFTLCSFVGIAVTSAGITLYGQTLWDPLKLIDQWDNRAAAFFAAFAFVLTTLGTNVSANSLCAGNDMTALCPRWINIRRGQVICAILGGWALCPWEILAR